MVWLENLQTNVWVCWLGGGTGGLSSNNLKMEPVNQDTSRQVVWSALQ